MFIEAFLWGFGTAIGELPPYFVARAASAAGGIDEELEDILKEENSSNSYVIKEDEDWMSRGKKKLAVFLKKHAFMTVLCMASVSLTKLKPDSFFDVTDSKPTI